MKFVTVAIVLLCFAGMLVPSLALAEHYNTQPSPCSINEVWDCGIVNHSPYAMVHGVPVAIIGIMGYGLLAALAGRFHRLTAAAALAGMIFTLLLTWIEWKVLGVWCIYCVSSQGIITVILIFATTAVLLARRGAQEPRRGSIREPIRSSG